MSIVLSRPNEKVIHRQRSYGEHDVIEQKGNWL